MIGDVHLVVPSGDRFIDVMIASSVLPIRGCDVERVIARLRDVVGVLNVAHPTEVETP